MNGETLMTCFAYVWDPLPQHTTMTRIHHTERWRTVSRLVTVHGHHDRVGVRHGDERAGRDLAPGHLHCRGTPRAFRSR